ncbi:fibrillin-1-like [Sycon ciliatum]|uniref:fibrillin-1-like n=1 Tax=Sycon ciliatum TaxID=27933 RepID=UPI0031F69A0B
MFGIAGDVDECDLRVDGCTGVASCVNTLGSFRCTCPPGYKANGTGCEGPVRAPKRILSGHGGDAVRPRSFRRVETAQEVVNILDAELDVDINECLVPYPHCEHRRCINEIGGFKCCQLGYIANRTMLNSAGIEECTVQACPKSSNFLGTVTDITNVLKRLTCNPGLALKPGVPAIQYCDGQDYWPFCVDVDECSLNIHKCTGMATCVNTHRSYQCTCSPAFRSNGTDCEDINECLLPSTPCEYERCINEIGNYTCCQPGYIANRTMLNSAGIEECTAQACPKSSSFLGTVTDITNVLKRLTCHPGLALEPGVPAIQYCDDQHLWPVCVDVDECSLNIHKCTGMATCVNTHRSYQCTCPPAFRSNGTDCEGK